MASTTWPPWRAQVHSGGSKKTQARVQLESTWLECRAKFFLDKSSCWETSMPAFEQGDLSRKNVPFFPFTRANKTCQGEKLLVWTTRFSQETQYLGPVSMGKICPEDPGHSSPRVALGASTIHTFLYKSKRAFTWQITTCLGEEGNPGGRVTRLTR